MVKVIVIISATRHGKKEELRPARGSLPYIWSLRSQLATNFSFNSSKVASQASRVVLAETHHRPNLRCRGYF